MPTPIRASPPFSAGHNRREGEWKNDGEAEDLARLIARESRPKLRRVKSRAAGLLLWFLAGFSVGLDAAAIRGLPFSRVYSLEDIGYVPRGSRLGFDRYGRVAVIHDGVYSVLNDTIWLDLADQSEADHVAIAHVVQGLDGNSYYGGLGSWGRAEIQSDGKLHAIPLMPDNPPAWTRASTFEDVLVTPDGVYFASRSGVAFRDAANGEVRLFDLPDTSKVFRVGRGIFVSGFNRPIQYLDVANRSIREVPSPVLNGSGENVVERATELDENRALISMPDGRLLVFDGSRATPWDGQIRNDLTGPIAALRRLVDGNIAISITGRGVFLLSPEGKLLSSLTIPQYHRVSDIASHQSGVMWLINEDSIEKILYDSGLTWFGQRLGLALEWPMVATWNDRLMVASVGVLYEAVSSRPGITARFEKLKEQPPNGAWALAASGRHLLVGNASGVYAATADRRFVPITTIKDLAHLVMVDEGLCYAIGPAEIALLAWNGEKWTEPAPRIPGKRNASVVHRAGRSAWIEMGGNGVARVSCEDGQLHCMVVPNQSWTKALWVNIGVVDDVVVLSGARNERRFFSEKTGAWCEDPKLAQLLNRSPEWLTRVRNDASGTLWATSNERLVRFTPKDGDYEMDALTYDLINDRYPVVHVLPDNEVWVTASRSLYHVESTPAPNIRSFPEPVLVSLTDTKRNIELLASPAKPALSFKFPYDQGDLTFRFFSRGYAWRRDPRYEFRLNNDEPWSTFDTGSLLRFVGLHEGAYQLQVRIAGRPNPPGTPLTLPFEILPPWHRTRPAYLLYGALALLAAFGVIRWSGHLARKRSRVLELLVQERTGQLESAMSKLNEETRITATLAERNRLAGEIHDSVQQGLSGAILQLDTTLTLPAVNEHLRTRLNVVRNMVSYSRQEVQHAVWDMDSPLLEGSDLGEALHKLATFVTSGKLAPRALVSGPPVLLSRSTTHHLLRIAQEATTNAIRHGEAQEIVIHLEYRPDAVVLSISDNGKGFEPETVLNQSGHFGLRGIRTRTKKLRGSLSIVSSPGEGTSIRLIVPLNPQPPTTDRDAENTPSRQNPNPACR